MRADGAIKHCSSCKQSLPLDHFHRNRAQADGLHSQCRTCTSEARRDHRLRKPEQKLATERAWREANPFYWLNRAGIFPGGPAEFEEMLAKHDGVCAICRRPPEASGRKRLSVDHDHETGRVRGLLCNRCNIAIGAFEDSPDLLMAAAAYLMTSADRPAQQKERVR